jgi:hypothetical protein
MDDDRDTPRGRDEMRRTRRGVDALLDDLVPELEAASHRVRTQVVINSLTGMLYEVFDAVRYRIDEIARDFERTTLTDDEIAVVVGGARQAIALAVEFSLQDELARARALGERHTAPAVPAGAFGRLPPPIPADARKPGRAGGTVPGMPSVPPPRRRDATVPVAPGDRVTAPNRTPVPVASYKGEPRPRSGAEAVDPSARPTPLGLKLEEPTVVRRRPRKPAG